MRISSGVLGLALLVWAGTAMASEPRGSDAAQAALERGLVAYKSGAYAAALPALKEAADKAGAGSFFAEFYMARIFADNAGGVTDHAKAFVVFRKLADENADVDPDDDQRAPFVAKSFIALAGYLRRGLPEIGVPANPRRAASYLHHAAIFFGDKEAQLELAKLYLSGEGGRDDVRRGLHYLSALSVQSYPAAQALLAELYWAGRHVKADARRALALITMAVEHAPAADRIWIEETYHSIYCATQQGARQEADGLMARWRKIFARPAPEPVDRIGLTRREMQPERQCANGEAVAIHRTGPDTGAVASVPAVKEPLQGNAFSLGFRAASGPAPAAASASK